MSSKLIACVVLLSLAVAIPAAAETIMIDDFNGTLNANWVNSLTLSNNAGSGDIVVGVVGGKLSASNPSYTAGARQEAMLRSDYSLGIGETLVTDLDPTAWTGNGTSYNSAGLCIAMNNAPGDRVDMLWIEQHTHVNNVTSYYAIGTDVTTGTGHNLSSEEIVDELYIKRVSANEYETGYSLVGSDERIEAQTITFTGANFPGTAVGYYYDIRQASSTSTFDNFRLETEDVPEPSTLALMAAGLLGLLAYAWRKRK